MGKFWEQMSADLEIRGLSPHTRRAYLSAVRAFVRHFMRPPDELTLDDIKTYQVHLTRERKVSWSAFNVAVAGIKFFYRVTLKKSWNFERIPCQKVGRRLPEILSLEEVQSIFTATANVKHRTLLMTVYAGGLRVSEVTALRVSDIDSDRMVIRIEQGKGRQDRYVMLSPHLLTALRSYWMRYKPETWLFPSRSTGGPLSARTVERVFEKAAERAGISKQVSPHSLRHAYATHLLEDGTNIRVIQTLLGHRSLRSTEIYTHVAKTYLKDTRSPLDKLPRSKKGLAGQA